MAATGVALDDTVISKFNDIKLGKLKARYVVYKIDSGKIVEDCISMDGSYDDFLGLLPEEDCRYALYDMNFTTRDGRSSSKLCFISWCPDTSGVRSKMLYAGSKDAIIRAFSGISVKINATDFSEVSEEAVVEACKKF